MNGIEFVVNTLTSKSIRLFVARDAYRPTGRAAVLIKALKQRSMPTAELASYVAINPAHVGRVLAFARKAEVVEVKDDVWTYVKKKKSL